MPHTCHCASSFRKTRLPQGQRRLDRARGRPRKSVASHHSTLIILDHRQPRPPSLPLAVFHPDRQQTMIRLPDLIRPARLSAIQQIILLAIRPCSLMSQGQQRCWHLPDDPIDLLITRLFPPRLATPSHSPDAGSLRLSGGGCARLILRRL
jgi:hypothetical protein